MNDVGAWVSQEFENLAQVINDYDQDLYLEMVPKSQWADLIDKKKIFRIVDDRNKKIVMYAEALSRPDEILAALWSMDQKHGSVMVRMETMNAAQQALKMKAEMDERGALRDFAMFVGKNTKSRWVHEGRVRDEEFRDLGPVRKAIV
jgi:RPA family protein